MLAIAREDLGRLDDMTAHEERRFWDFTFTCATNGLTDLVPARQRRLPRTRQHGAVQRDLRHE